jgi:glycyl-tRNA synthetase beta chain
VAEFLIELLSEEIPAGMQERAAADLKRLVTDGLKDAGLTFDSARAFSGPRRLTLVVDGLPERQPDRTEERKGPRADAPDKAIEGFLKSVGMTRDQLEEHDTKKGKVLFAVIEESGKPTADVLHNILADVLFGLPWPKSMRSADFDMTWVRPLHRLVAIFGGSLIPFWVSRRFARGKRAWGKEEKNRYDDEKPLGAITETAGHPWHAPEAFAVKDFADYEAKLRAAKVILDAEERKDIIRDGANKLAKAEGLTLVEDEALVTENAGLTEWPVPLMGRLDEAFLELPPEVLRTSMRTHQKYFALQDATGKLAPRFIVIANIEAEDGGKAIVAGNERVLRARLADAQFFWDQDRKNTLASRAPRLSDIVFHAKLGALDQKADRVQALAAEIGAHVPGTDKDRVRSAGRLAKADLVTQMVVEFPGLQGVMGRYYALADGEHEDVARAIAEHYAPQGPNDGCPTAPVSVAVALADKIDTLVGFFAIDEKPTGSKDPYALRRAALGVIRLVLENSLDISLLGALRVCYRTYLLQQNLDNLSALSNLFDDVGLDVVRLRSLAFSGIQQRYLDWDNFVTDFVDKVKKTAQVKLSDPRVSEFRDEFRERVRFLEEACTTFADEERADQTYLEESSTVEDHLSNPAREVLAFIADRLKVHLRERGVRHDLIAAVFALTGEDDLVRLLARVEALQNFLGGEDGANLLTAYKRASNIVRIEEKKEKDGGHFDDDTDAGRFEADEEKVLHAALGAVKDQLSDALREENYDDAFRAFATLRPPIDSFFDNVTVNVEDRDVRANRLRLLSRINVVFDSVADFSQIEG